jgi:transcriptional regulator with XRE-family HTH domain
MLDILPTVGNIGGMTLKDYLKQSDDTAASLASRVGISPGAVHKYAYGQREPSIATAEKIERETGGVVTIPELARPTEQSAAA